MDYSKYIFPLGSTIDGSGVIVGDLFITAGHVIENIINPNVYIDGILYDLNKEKALFIDSNKEGRYEGYDVAIFQLKGINSPLILSDKMPSEKQELLSCSYKLKVSGNNEQASYIFNSIPEEKSILELRYGRVISYYGNFFECEFQDSLAKGSSGSPIFDGDKVAGILCGDKEDKECSKEVIFLSASAIVSKLTEDGIYG